MRKRYKQKYAFAAWHPEMGLNEWWIRPMARNIRERNEGRPWKNLRRKGWRIVKVKLVEVGKRR